MDFKMNEIGTITRDEYDQLDARGKITRPLTWGTMRRHAMPLTAADSGFATGCTGLVAAAPRGS